MSAEHFTARRQEERRKKSLTQGNRKSFSGFSTAGKEEKNVWIAVEDNGPGIPKEDQSHIFDRFYRVDKARSRETGGTGLGLSIVHQMVLMHGGTVSVDSEEGNGATFTVELPIHQG